MQTCRKGGESAQEFSKVQTKPIALLNTKKHIYKTFSKPPKSVESLSKFLVQTCNFECKSAKPGSNMHLQWGKLTKNVFFNSHKVILEISTLYFSLNLRSNLP